MCVTAFKNKAFYDHLDMSTLLGPRQSLRDNLSEDEIVYETSLRLRCPRSTIHPEGVGLFMASSTMFSVPRVLALVVSKLHDRDPSAINSGFDLG